METVHHQANVISLTKVYLCLIHYNHAILLLSHYEQSAETLLQFTEEEKTPQMFA